jgi:hypothetical protein
VSGKNLTTQAERGLLALNEGICEMGGAVAEEKVTLNETSMRIAASKNKRQQRTSMLVANQQYNDIPPCSVSSAGRFCLIILITSQ